MGARLYRPSCTGCPHDLYYLDDIPKKQYGVMMHCGERFCTGGKRARRFKRSDPTVYVPAWCPKRKSPCELRLYRLKDSGEWVLHDLMDHQLRGLFSPAGFRYALVSESHTSLTPYEFWKRCHHEPYGELLGMELQRYEVVELDDGLKPAFFYMSGEGLQLAPFFNAAAAKKNRREDAV